MEVELNNNKTEEKMGPGTGTGSGTENREREQKQEEEIQEQYRVVIDRNSSDILEQLKARVTDGSDAISITKSDIANWLVKKALASFQESDAQELREQHFDDRKLLASLLKESKDDSALPESLKRAIREHYGLGQHLSKSKSKKLIKSA